MSVAQRPSFVNSSFFCGGVVGVFASVAANKLSTVPGHHMPLRTIATSIAFAFSFQLLEYVARVKIEKKSWKEEQLNFAKHIRSNKLANIVP
jgi:hypothetical protein